MFFLGCHIRRLMLLQLGDEHRKYEFGFGVGYILYIFSKLHTQIIMDLSMS